MECRGSRFLPLVGITRLADGFLCRPSGTWFHFVCLTPGLKSLRQAQGRLWAIIFRRSAAWSFFRFASHGLRPFDRLRAGRGLHSCAALRLRSGQAFAASVYVSWVLWDSRNGNFELFILGGGFLSCFEC